MTVGDTIDGVLIESDETGFKLILSGHHAEYHFDIHGIADEFLRTVKREIEPWWLEGERVRVEYEQSTGEIVVTPAERAYVEETIANVEAYERTNPKSPDYHDTMSELWDNREK